MMASIFPITLILFLLTTALAIPTISINGAKFFLSNGKQFFIKGVTYPVLEMGDPLTDSTTCTADTKLMKDLGVNSVTLYYVDISLNHTACMNIYADAGIYLWISLVNPLTGINRNTPQWTNDMFLSYAAVMDVFAPYQNTAGFWIGTEVVSSVATTNVAPYIKAVARDLKAYAASQGYRSIPFGYSSSDVPATSPYLQNYFACGQNRSETVDFFGRNQYTWCGDSTMQLSGYDVVYKNTTSLNIPTFFSETGCISGSSVRKFSDQTAILGPDMNDVFSGAFIYSWRDGGIGGYEVVNVVDGTLTPNVANGYSYLKSQWATLTATGTPSAAYYPTLKPPSCPTSIAGSWLLNGDAALPATAYTTLPVRVVSTTVATLTSRPTQLPTLTKTSSLAKTTTSTAAGATDSGAADASTELSVGAKAGIGIGASLFGAVASGLIIFYLLRRRHRQNNATDGTGYEKAELAGSLVIPPHQQQPQSPVEIYTDVPAADTTGLYEISGTPRVQQQPLIPMPENSHVAGTAGPVYRNINATSGPMGYEEVYLDVEQTARTTPHGRY